MEKHVFANKIKMYIAVPKESQPPLKGAYLRFLGDSSIMEVVFPLSGL